MWPNVAVWSVEISCRQYKYTEIYAGNHATYHIFSCVYSKIYARVLLINYDFVIGPGTYPSESTILCHKAQPRKKQCRNTLVLFFDRACRALSIAISRRRELTDVLVYLHPGAKNTSG